MLKRVLLTAGVVLLGLGAFAGVTGFRAWRYVKSTLHPPRVPVPAPPPIAGLLPVTFREPGGLALSAWWVPSQNHAAIILGHGWASNRDQLSFELTVLARHGYGVLAFDWPGHGNSEGEIVTWGDRERLALTSAIDFVTAQAGVEPGRIGALGFSMGGSTVVEVAAQDPRLKAIAISGTYTGLSEEFHHEMRKWGPFSEIPAIWALNTTDIDINVVRPVAVICQVAPRELMIIDGTDDPSAPLDMEQRLFGAACSPKSLWVVQGAHHGDYATIDPVGYEQHLVALFDRSLLK